MTMTVDRAERNSMYAPGTPMRAWRVLRSAADQVDLVEIPAPAPGVGELIVGVEAIGLNSSELQLIRGDWDGPGPGSMRRYPLTPGLEAAGTVVAVGEAVDPARVGERVTVHYRWSCGDCDECVSGFENTCKVAAHPASPKFGRTIDGSYAEFARVPARFAIPLPDRVSAVDAAAMTVAGGTAWHMAMVRGRLRAGETVLVTAGSSGVGTMLCQIAQRAGCRVAATAGGPDKVDKLRDLGVEVVFDHRADGDWSADLNALSHGKGVDCVLDIAGAGTWPRFLPSMAFRGRIVVGGYMSGEVAPFDLKDSTIREITVLGSSSWSRASLRKVLAMAGRGELRAETGSVLSFSELPAGLEMLRDRTAYASLVVEVGN